MENIKEREEVRRKEDLAYIQPEFHKKDQKE